jgi:hypothetical protein
MNKIEVLMQSAFPSKPKLLFQNQFLSKIRPGRFLTLAFDARKIFQAAPDNISQHPLTDSAHTLGEVTLYVHQERVYIYIRERFTHYMRRLQCKSVQ